MVSRNKTRTILSMKKILMFSYAQKFFKPQLKLETPIIYLPPYIMQIIVLTSQQEIVYSKIHKLDYGY